ncbi:MAG: YesL family protein [Lachnospiraceae bacterium]|nr:YesL family protein [Lachnospiraceae bacterium]
MGAFHPDSEFMQALGRVADFVILNVLCVLFSLPVVTAGAAMTAKYYVSMKIIRGEEPVVFQAFWRSFRDNFKQATMIWLPALVILLVLAWDWYAVVYGDSQGMPAAGRILLLVMTLLVCMVIYAVFPFLARFQMSTSEALKGAMVFCFLHFPKMLLVLLVIALPYVLALWYIEWALGLWFFITTVALYYISRMFVKEFKKIEKEEQL